MIYEIRFEHLTSVGSTAFATFAALAAALASTVLEVPRGFGFSASASGCRLAFTAAMS